MLKLINSENYSTMQETFERHDKLNPKLWKDNELLPDVKETINKIVDKFISDMNERDIPIKVVDVYLLGSNVNYNYTDRSDLDIHIIASADYECDKNHLDKMYELYKTLFNLKYDIEIKGITVELYIELDNNLTNRSSGIYSLTKGWIKEPSYYEIPEINEADLASSITEWENRYLEITKNPNLSSIYKFLDDIYDMRIKSISEDGEFGIGNLVFKEMRNLGYLDDIKDLKTELENIDLSLK